MTPQALCDHLDALRITTKDAAKRMGISRGTLEMYTHGVRYPSHGGKPIHHVPIWLEMLVRNLT